MTSARGYIATLVVLLAGGVALLVASGLTWGAVEAVGRAVPPVVISGRDVLPVTQAVGLLALAAVVAVHATRRWGRWVIGGLLTLAGTGVAGWAFLVARELPDRLLGHVNGPAADGGLEVTAANTGASTLAAVGGLLVGAAGMAIAIRGPEWPGMGTRYERDQAAPPTGRRAVEPAADHDRDAWKALDRGEDPTA